MNTSNTIPTELLLKIVTHLSLEEKRVGLLICKNWYEIFRHSLYDSITIKNVSQLKFLLDCLRSTQKKISFAQCSKTSNGQYVKQISIQSNKLSMLYIHNKSLGDEERITLESLFEHLPKACPNLERLNFDPSIWKSVSYHNRIVKWKRLRQLPTLANIGISLPYLQGLGDQLTTLSIESDMLVSISTQSALVSILSMVPRLKQFTIQGGEVNGRLSLSMTEQDIETIHSLLPSLEHLKITGDNIRLIYASKSNQGGKHPIVKNLKSLYLESRLITPVWIYYIACKYPHLEELSMNIQFNEEDDIHWNSFEDFQAEKPLFLYLANKCHHLRVIALSCPIMDHWLNCAFFETLKKNNSIRQIRPIVKRNNQIKSDSELSTALTHGKEWLTALEIEQWRFDSNLVTTFKHLSNFSQLSYLSIVCDSYNSEYNMAMLLDSCPLLETLVVEWGTLYVDGDDKDEKKIVGNHPLSVLDMTFIAVTPCVFSYLSRRCSSLANLSLNKCKQSLDNGLTSQTQFLIDMPNNCFDTIVIHGVRLDTSPLIYASPKSRYIRYISIKTCLGTNWYKHTGYCQDYPLLEQQDLNNHTSTSLLHDNVTPYIKLNCKAIDNISLDSYIVCHS